MTAVELLPIIREAFSQRPDWTLYPPERLVAALYVHGYAWELPEVFEVEAVLAALDIERGAA